MKITLFIDESGTLPDPSDKVIVIAGVGIESLQDLGSIFKAVKKRRSKIEKPLELKFYKAGNKTKGSFFDRLSREKDVALFVLIIDKLGRSIADSPENFAILCGLLISEVLLYEQINRVILDRHFHRLKDQEEFNSSLLEFLDKPNLSLEHVDSTENILVNVADMIAGAVLAKETGKDASFYQIIKDKIISETKLNWPEAKRRLKKLA